MAFRQRDVASTGVTIPTDSRSAGVMVADADAVTTGQYEPVIHQQSGL
jgi:hypothetical protein